MTRVYSGARFTKNGVEEAIMRLRPGLVSTLILPLALAACDASIIGGGNNGDGGGDGDGAHDAALAPFKIPGCTGPCTVKHDCPPAMGPTTITGVVNIPAGNLPLYNAQVFIPTGDRLPPPPTSGASCDRCVSMPSAFATTT